ncbi:hypothetical protein MVEG_12256 [Podila verticillata NRRL 6337]|uniref:Uncharacterized protein n=1 Tax=Podila verticillata NRRL 6337 TaxID=1069443 RepID=A0A086TIZ5_9FUNG|nr:hypothetical protein MVEG_12256 [Podila verticillata NRRL 6337]
MFKEYGLQLAEPVIFPSLLITGPKPIIDYSKFTARLDTSEWQSAAWHQFLQLTTRPNEHLETGFRDRTPELHEADSPLWLSHQQDYHYKQTLQQRISALLTTRGPGCVQELSVHVRDVHKYLPLAEEMKQLAKLNIHREGSIPEEHIQDLITFIQRINNPRKRLKYLFTDGGWNIDTRNLLTKPEKRAKLIQFHNPTIPLYELVPSPNINVSYFPDFYKLVGRMDKSQIQVVFDCHEDRVASGETLLQQEFLKGCPRLHSLNIRVQDPRVFAWAVHNATVTTQRLETLVLNSNSGTVVFPALEDLIIGFGRSLRKIHARVDIGGYGSVSIGSHTLSRWNMPFVQAIELNVREAGFLLFMSALDQCPQLSILKIQGPIPHRSNLDGLSPTEKLSVSPKWYLPNLKTLDLYGLPALLFNYDTLTDSPSLETLSIVSWVTADLTKRIARLSEHLTYGGSQDVNSGQPHARSEDGVEQEHGRWTEQEHGRWTEQWNLPKVTSMTFRGAPSIAFCFNQLKGCPQLKALWLSTPAGFAQRLPFSWKSAQATQLPSVTGSLLEKNMEPLLNSSVLKLDLNGRFFMTEEEFSTLLSDYVPNLAKLEVDRINEGLKSCGLKFVQAIQEADRVQGRRGRLSPLLQIYSGYTLKKSNRIMLGLVKPPYKEQHHILMRRHGQRTARAVEHGIRLYSLVNQELITREDAWYFAAIEE